MWNIHSPNVLHGIKGYKPALSCVLAWSRPEFERALLEPPVCVHCGTGTTVQQCTPFDQQPPGEPMYGVRVYCSNCTRASFSSLHDIALDLPQVRCFWQTYPRIRMLPEQQIRIDGRAVLLARIENVVGTERFDVLFAQNTFAVIGVHGSSDG